MVFSATGTHCARLRSQWEDVKGKHKANQLTETFPVLVLSDEEEAQRLNVPLNNVEHFSE